VAMASFLGSFTIANDLQVVVVWLLWIVAEKIRAKDNNNLRCCTRKSTPPPESCASGFILSKNPLSYLMFVTK
jgi:hypothetical protein